MGEGIEQQLRLDDWAGLQKAERKPLPVEETPDAPVLGKWKDHPLYQVWRNIKCRCFTPGNTDFHRYGGRGIKVCERWMHFESFALDMGPKPTPFHTIERIDRDGDYEPGNCRWATRKEQCSNTIRNRVISMNGQSMTVTQCANMIGMPAHILFHRLYKGWTIEKSIGTPYIKRK